MTPTEHKAQAEALLTTATDTTGRYVDPNDSDFDVIAAHTALASAAGTGSHYTAAEAALAVCATARSTGNQMTYLINARVALAHARLADH